MEERKVRFDEFYPHGLISVLLKNLWVIAVLCISVIMCYGSVYKLTYTPRYTSSATFMVSAKDSSSAYNSLTTTQSMASIFVEVFQSNVLREKIRVEMPDQQFDGAISTTTIPQTNLLVVTVTAPKPDTAFRALNLLIDNYSSISDYLFANAQLEVIKDPVVPTRPANPMNVKAKHVPVLLITAFLSASLIVVLYLIRDTVKTPAGARRKLDARLLRTINHEVKNKTVKARLRRKNVAPLLNGPLIKKHFIEDNLSLCSALEYHAKKRGQKVVLVTSVGENEGKSTIAANLALALAEKGRKVVLLDCDFRKPSLHKIFEMPVQKERTLTSYLLQDETNPVPYLTQLKKHGIYLGFSQSANRNITRLLNNGKLPVLLQYLKERADYIILDTPPMLAAADAETIAAMADTAMLVVRSDFMPTKAVNDGLDRLRKSAPDVCGLVLNNYYTTLL